MANLKDFSLSTENATRSFPVLDVALGKQIMARSQVFLVFFQSRSLTHGTSTYEKTY
jgi:hypothetical protein